MSVIPMVTRDQCIQRLRDLATANPDRIITRSLFRAYSGIPEFEWGKHFEGFKAFRRAALGGLSTPEPEVLKIAPAEEQEAEDPIASRRDQQTITSLRGRVKMLEDRLIMTENERDTYASLRNVTLQPTTWSIASPSSQASRLSPILFTSDFQLGEVIKAEEIDGINSYNMDVFAERYTRLIERTIDIADNHTGNSEFPGCYYLRGGDAISGGIHLELKDTDDLSAVPAVRYLIRYEREGIRRLQERFGRVKVVSIPGNHGRTSLKPRSKGYVEHSYETLLTWWLASTFESDPNVEFITPASGDAFFDAEGWKFLLAHGDRMGSRGGQGFIGPAATIARGHQKLYQNWASSGRAPDVILTGHLHTSLKLQRGFANGSLAGYGDYARDIQALPDAAKQWLLFVHERRGVAQAFEVQLSDRPRRSSPNIEF